MSHGIESENMLNIYPAVDVSGFKLLLSVCETARARAWRVSGSLRRCHRCQSRPLHESTGEQLINLHLI